MTRIVLLRHAHSVANAKGILAGRLSNVPLSERGLIQAEKLKEQLQEINFSAIYLSPMERCAQTISPFVESLSSVQRKKIRIEVDPDLNEVDYGKWSGKKLALLSRDKLWKVVQNHPSSMYFPEGEGLLQMQARAVRALNSAAHSKGTGPKLLVSHGDVIKAIIANIVGTHLDHFQKIVIDPASISILDFNGEDFRLLTMNNTTSTVSELVNLHSKSGKSLKALLGGGSGGSKR